MVNAVIKGMRNVTLRLLPIILLSSVFLQIPALAGALQVNVSVTLEGVTSGRLILFLRRVDTSDPLPGLVDANAFERGGVIVVAREVRFRPGSEIRLDGDDLAFPASLSDLPNGRYVAQAVLDPDHNYAYSGRGPGDVVSDVAVVNVDGSVSVTLPLTRTLPPLQKWHASWGAVATDAELPLIEQQAHAFAYPSKLLGRFFGREVTMNGFVVTPLDYDKTTDRLPTAYLTHGFGGGMTSLQDTAAGLVRQMQAGAIPRMLWILLDQSGPFGTHEFADSANNGPWGTALTTELIPELESSYRTEGRANARFVMGHSSGGWAALWLQLSYPQVFGGAWATSPDYLDFTDFDGVDITAPGARLVNTDFARFEAVLGEFGGQASSFEAVWSPRGADGRPMPLYDRETGLVDPAVAASWRANWDLSEKVRREWNNNRQFLDGKIKVIVGEEDEFDLDQSVRRLQRAVEQSGGIATFRYIPRKGHFDLYVDGKDRAALRRTIAWEMWRKAYPTASR